MLLTTKEITYKKQSSSFRGALRASWVMAFAGLGDAILYPLLPVYGAELGFSALFIGILLSINRFVRIISNTHIANLINQIGMKKMLIATSMLATLTTFVYGLKLGAVLFLIARVLWGLSYSGLKIATLNYASKSEKNAGLAFGLTTAIKSLGGLFVLWFGSHLIAAVGVQKGLFLIASVSIIGILLAFTLPNIPSESKAVNTKQTFYPSTINILVFLMSLTVDGIMVVALSNLIGGTMEVSEVLILVTFYLFLKKLFTLLFSILSGVLSIKIRPSTLFSVGVICVILALLLIVVGFPIIGIIVAFLFNTIVVTFSPLVAIEQQKEHKNSLQAISSVSTWWDLGAALGAFIGIMLVNALGVQTLFLILSITLTILFIIYIIQNATTNRSTI